MASRIEKAVQTGVQHFVPLLVFHENQQIITSDACIVNQNGNVFVLMISAPFVQRFVYGFRTRYVKRQEFSLSSLFFYHFQSLLGSFAIRQVINKNNQPVLSQL